MVNFDDYAIENKTEHNLKWGVVVGSESGKNRCIVKFNKQPARY